MSLDKTSPLKLTIKRETTDRFGRTRPDGLPKTDKNFKKVVQSVQEQLSQEEEESPGLEKEDVLPLPSLFELATKSKLKKSTLDKSLLPKPSFGTTCAAASPSTAPALEPMCLPEEWCDSSFKEISMTTDLTQQPSLKEGLAPSEKKTRVQVDAKREKGKLGARARTEWAKKNGDLFTLTSPQQAIHFNPEKVDLKEEDSLSSSTIKELAAQLIDHIYTVRKEGRTDTVVTLRYPPLLEGATVTLSTQEGAKRQFNIAFANLTEAAKQFLDRKLTENSLTAILERKGIAVLALTTATLPQISIPLEAEQYFGRGEREQQQQRQQDLDEETT